MNDLYFYGTSLLCHLLLFLGAILTWQASSSVQQARGEHLYVQAYVREMQIPRPAAQVAIKPVMKKKKEHPRKIPQIAKQVQGLPTSALLEKLHAAIQQQQHYPESAIEMAREGRTTVSFTLLINGQISDLHIVKSSGTLSLDEAALAAVREAVPFRKIQDYLKEARTFSIDVVFEMA